MAAAQGMVSGAAGRYSTALFELASEAGSVEATGAGLDRFNALLDESPDLMRLVKSPVFGADEQIAALEGVLRRAKIDGLAADFLKLVAKNRRLYAIREMIAGYKALVANARGEMRAEVTSAEKLSAAQLEKLKTALKASVGRDVQLETHIDPDILGGLIVKVGSRMVDNSLKTKLQSMKIAMRGA